MSKGKVLVAMSGGIDSTVAALILHKQGYQVIGITMKTWDYTEANSTGKETGCCNLDSFYDARQVAVENGFPHYIFDIREEFDSHVVQNFVDEYIAGRTPNPCIMCNTHIKWKALLKKATHFNCDFIATGHYAQTVNYQNGRVGIKKGIDELKDQSYVLWGLEQQVLKKTIFPIGQFQKKEIRKMAFDFGYESLSKKSESYEICFIPNNDYRDFLQKNVPDKINHLNGGWFVDKFGQKLGQHKGYPFYTIGQRKGLNIALGKPAFVTKIDPENNVVVLGDETDLNEQIMMVGSVNFIKYPELTNDQVLTTKIRYKDPGMLSSIHISEEQPLKVKVIFQQQVKGIAPGQSAVFYEHDEVVGGGIIQPFF
ncbi:MAG: tRNA 2-thiouridine(34) synthase MnmA [Sediminibacterium sp.]|nr:tRNA 2-thiouridine(34) synthase MnmA [Sediminibacterium sp.]